MRLDGLPRGAGEDAAVGPGGEEEAVLLDVDVGAEASRVQVGADEGVEGVFRFLSRLWRLCEEVENGRIAHYQVGLKLGLQYESKAKTKPKA